MRLREILICLLLGAPAGADLDRAERCLQQYRFAEARQEALRCRAEDPQRSELLQLWAMENLLEGDEARVRLRSFRPDEGHARLYLIVHSMLERSDQRKDLEKALQLSSTPAQQVDVLLRLFRAHPFPKDQEYWQEAAEIASKTKLSDELLVRLSLAHLNLLCSLKRPQEGFADLALADRLLRKDPSRSWRIEWARVELLNALGQREEARKLRLRLPELSQTSLQAVQFLFNESEHRSETSRANSQQILDQLHQIRRKARDWNSRLDLLSFRLRSNLADFSQVGLAQWRQQADSFCRSAHPDERLLGLSERARVLFSQGEFEKCRPDLEAAYRLARSRPGSQLFANAQPRHLSLLLAQVASANKRFSEAQEWARRSLAESASDFDLQLPAQLHLLAVYLRTGQMDRASQTMDAIFAGAEKVEAPLQRAIAYSQLLSFLMLSSFESNLLTGEPAPFRVDPDSAAGWLFADIRASPERQARIFKALDELKRQSSHPSLLGVEGLFRAFTLGSLDRPLEALDAYSQAMEKTEGYGALQSNTGLLYAYELWGAGRRPEALEVLSRAHQQAVAGSALASPENYRLAYANALLRSAHPTQALELIEQGLKGGGAPMRPSYLLLRGRALGSVADLQEALDLTKRESAREEILLELHRLQPEQPWLAQFRSRDPKRALLLMRLSSPEQALKIGRESLEHFREVFEQLPTSARAASLRSPSLNALIQAVLEASLKANNPGEGAHCLAVWRALQSQPGPVSPELEQLRAELTGLRAANDPNLADRLADTRAQFRLKLNQLRQINPEMEKSLSAQVSELLALQPQLDPGVLLVQYFTAADGLYVQALTREQQQLFKVPIEKARLLELLQRWTSALHTPRPFSPEELTASRQLYSHLIEPLAPLLQEHPDLWLMPGGELWDLPFETLLDSQEHYLMESAGCAYLGPSETLQLVRAPAAPSGSWVGVSNARLPGTVKEIEQLKLLFAEARTTQSWLELKGLAPQARILHLATHSQALPDRATESWLEMTEGPIALEKIYQLVLPAGSLVVLSSCSGAVPQLHRERDLISLSSGFRAAGASSVIAALWPVDDESTSSFFAPMYQALLQGQSRLQALRRAKLALVRQHPFYWAGFTLLGDPR